MFVTVKFMTQSGLGVKILLRIRSSPLHFTSSPQTRTRPSHHSPSAKRQREAAGASFFCKAHIDTSGFCKRKMLGQERQAHDSTKTYQRSNSTHSFLPRTQKTPFIHRLSSISATQGVCPT